MSEMFSLLSVQYTALFSIINPLGSAFIFFSITRALPMEQREMLARRVGLYALMTLLVSLFGGAYLLHFFGITMPVLRVAGGLIVALAAWQLLTTSEDPMDSATPSMALGKDPSQIAFFPLTMPLTIGPGSISVAITLGVDAPSRLQERIASASISVLAIALVALTTYYCYRDADRLTRILGQTGTAVIVRVSGFLLFCIGIQIIWMGTQELLLSVLPR